MVLAYTGDRAKAVASARASAEQAVSLDPNEAVAHLALGRVLILAGAVEMAIGEMQVAIGINPNYARGHFGLGFAYYYGAGQPAQALPNLDAALRLSPRDPMRWRELMVKGSALRMLGRHDEAIAHCRQACQLPDVPFLTHMNCAASLAAGGQISEAQAAVEKAIELKPALSIRFLGRHFRAMHETTLKGLLDSLRKAGLPE